MNKTITGFMPHVPGAFPGGLRRTAFYDGMVLSEADMTREQSYWQMKRRLTNRALGQGVVWGLSVQWDDRKRAFTLCPGYGISCCGDDLIVECAATVTERELIDICSEDFRALLSAAQGPCDDPCDRRPDAPIEACLMLEYVECPEESRQVFEDPCATLPGGCRFGTMRETTRLRLVPPPCPDDAGPLERFCARIDKLRDRLGGTNPQPVAMAAAASLQAPAVSINADLRDAAGSTITNQQNSIETAPAAKSALSFTTTDFHSLAVTLTPPLGYAFLMTRDDSGTTTRIETLMQLKLLESDLRTGGRMDRQVTVELAPLAGGASWEVDYKIAASGAKEPQIEVVVTGLRGPKRVPDCGTLMQNWVFDIDPDCAARTLLLAAICGWFKGLTGTAPCNDAPAEPDPTRAAIAALVCWQAWQLLWNIDIHSDNGAEAERCLRKLFQEFCAEMHYRGPRCDCDQHGIILGCLTLSPKGKILCFDEWDHRRHVLTGPLLTHWTGLAGIAPLDTTAARLASWICCVARTPDQQLDPAAIKALMDQFMSAEGKLPDGLSRAFPLDMLMKLGNWLNGDSGHTKPGPAKPLPAVEVATYADHMKRQIEAKLDTAPVMARQPALDMVSAVKNAVSLADLKPVGDAVLFDATVAAMDRISIANADSLFARDPESVARKIATDLIEDGVIEDAPAAERAVALVYTAALRALDSVATAVVTEALDRAEDQPFTRANIKDDATTSGVRKALNKTLRGRGLSVPAVNGIAAKIADRR